MNANKKVCIVIGMIALISLIFLFLATWLNTTKLLFVALGLTIIAVIGLSIQVIIRLNKQK